jgi:hypothetical protein
VDDETLRRAVIRGSALASFSVEAFSLDRLLAVTPGQLAERLARFTDLTSYSLT